MVGAAPVGKDLSEALMQSGHISNTFYKVGMMVGSWEAVANYVRSFIRIRTHWDSWRIAQHTAGAEGQNQTRQLWPLAAKFWRDGKFVLRDNLTRNNSIKKILGRRCVYRKRAGRKSGRGNLDSRHLMKGYWKRPDATAATIDADGWLHTGRSRCKDLKWLKRSEADLSTSDFPKYWQKFCALKILDS